MANYIQIPPDSTGKKIFNVAHVTGSDTIYAQVTHIADPVNPNQIQSVDVYGAATVTFAEGAPTITPLGNIRMGEGVIIGGYEYSTGAQDSLFYQRAVAGGVLQLESSSMLLQTSTASGSHVIQSTNRYHFYQAGNGMLLLNSLVVGDTGKNNNIRRWGLFDNLNGVFFELSGSVLSTVVRSDATGIVTERKWTQDEWDHDKFNGTGTSQFILDITKVNVYFIDYAWLGAGRIRFGALDEHGNRLTCMIIHNIGVITNPWSSRSSFPVRIENINMDTTVSTSEIRHICAAVYAEARTDYVYWRYADLNSARKPCADDTPIMSLRAKQIYNGRINRVNSYPEDITVYVEGGPLKLEAVWNSNLTGSAWDVPSIGPLEADVSASSYTYEPDGYVFRCWMLGPGTHQIDLTKHFETNDEGILLNGDGVTQSAFSFTGTSLNMSTPATASMVLNYRELS